MVALQVLPAQPQQPAGARMQPELAWNLYSPAVNCKYMYGSKLLPGILLTAMSTFPPPTPPLQGPEL